MRTPEGKPGSLPQNLGLGAKAMHIILLACSFVVLRTLHPATGTCWKLVETNRLSTVSSWPLDGI